MNEKRKPGESITNYASLLNAAHLLAEESTQRLHELALRYPDALPPEVVHRLLPGTDGQDASFLNRNSF